MVGEMTLLTNAIKENDQELALKIISGRSMAANLEFLCYFLFFNILWLPYLILKVAFFKEKSIPEIYTFSSYLKHTTYFQSPYERYSRNYTPLQLAALLKCTSVIYNLIGRKGINIEERVEESEQHMEPNPLALAIQADASATALVLLSAGANSKIIYYEPDLVNGNNDYSYVRITTPIFAAIEHCNTTDVLTKICADTAATSQRLSYRTYLLRNNSANKIGLGNVPPILHAILNGNEITKDFINILLQNNTNPNDYAVMYDNYRSNSNAEKILQLNSDHRYLTPLAASINLRLDDITMLLLKSGAKITLQDHSYPSKLKVVIPYSVTLQAIRFALEHNIQLADAQLGDTPEEILANRNRMNIINEIEQIAIPEAIVPVNEPQVQAQNHGLQQRPSILSRLLWAFSARTQSILNQVRLEVGSITRINAIATPIEQALTRLRNIDPAFNFDADIYADLRCPIVDGIFLDPVMTAAGNTYERFYIKLWLDNSNIDPLSGTALAHKELTPNLTLRRIIISTIQERITIAEAAQANPAIRVAVLTAPPP